jgi:hypothetical protein
MGTPTQLQQNRRIMQDFASTALAPIANSFARLVYLASLRNLGTNVYEHAGLAAVYGKDAVQQALRQCHEELFERILELPLPVQESDLRAYFASLPGGAVVAATNWRKLEAYRGLLPVDAPDYLKELFCSNIRAIVAIAAKEASPTTSSPQEPEG